MKTIISLVLVFLLGMVVTGYYFTSKEKPSVENNQVTPTVAVLLTETPTLTTAPTESIISDVELIKQALVKKHNWQPDEIIVTVNKNDGTYASGGVREKATEVGGGYFFAAKVNGEWKIVADGNGVIECADLIPYPDYPTSMIPECYDMATQKSITR